MGTALAASSLLALAAGGCSTTQQTAARQRLVSARILASREPIRVKREDPSIEVTRTSVVHSKQGTAVIVGLHNSGADSVNDLPIELSASRGGPLQPINERSHAYFDNHAPALAPGASGSWVYTTKKPLHGRVFARVGTATKPPTTAGSSLPGLDVSAAKGGSKPARTLAVNLTNSSDIPQYGVVVFATTKGPGAQAAGRAVVQKLDPGASTTVDVKLVGRAPSDRLQLSAPATIFN